MNGLAWGLAELPEAPNKGTSQPVMFLVLLALADAHNHDTGKCNPGIPNLVKRTKVRSETAVRRAVRALEEAGIIRNLGQRKGWELFPELASTDVVTPTRVGHLRPAVGHMRPLLPSRESGESGGTYGTSSNGGDAYASKPKTEEQERGREERRQAFQSAKVALAEVWGQDLKFAGRSAHARLAMGANTLLRLGFPEGSTIRGRPADLPSAIRLFGEVWTQIYPDTECTPQSVVREWGRFVSGKLEQQAAGVTEERERRQEASRRIARR